MKLKFPKTIIIGSTIFNIKTDPKRVSAEFYYWDYDQKTKKTKRGAMIIGTQLLKSNPLSVLESIIHELKEAIQSEQRTRFSRSDKGAYEFHYYHDQHSDLCSRLAGLLDQFIV